MSNYAVMAKLKQIQEEIANHKREWCGALGTSWERDDLKRKQNELKYYCGMALIMGLVA